MNVVKLDALGRTRDIPQSPLPHLKILYSIGFRELFRAFDIQHETFFRVQFPFGRDDVIFHY